jgi:PadR family transcriptional regulator, regulatory protein PadR
MVDEIRMTLQTGAILTVLLSKPLKPRYGLEIAKEARLPGGTLYPALARLEEAGWITSEWEDIDEAAQGRRRRRYYKLTGEGVVAAQKALEAAAQKLSPSWLPAPGATMGGAQA